MDDSSDNNSSNNNNLTQQFLKTMNTSSGGGGSMKRYSTSNNNNSFVSRNSGINSKQLIAIQRAIDDYLDTDTGDAGTIIFEANETLARQQEYIKQLEHQIKADNSTENELSTKSVRLTNTEKELQELKSKYYELEKSSQFFKTRASESMIRVQDIEQEMERKIGLKNKEIDDITSKLRYITQSEEEAKKRSLELELQYSELERQTSLKLKAMEKEKLQWRSEVVDLKHKVAGSNEEAQIKSKDSKIDSLNILNKQLQQEVSDIKSRLNSTLELLSDKDRQLESFLVSKEDPILNSLVNPSLSNDEQIKKLQTRLIDSETLNQSIKNELNYYKDVNEKNLKQLSNLKSQLENLGNIEIIKQQNESLQDKLARYQEIIENFNKLEIKHNLLVQEKKDLEKKYGEFDKFQGGPEQFLQRIAILENENQTYVGKIGELTSNLKLLESRNSDIESTILEEKSSLSSKNNRIDEFIEKIKRLETQNYIYKKEIEGLNKILDLFDLDSVVNSNAKEGTDGGDTTAATSDSSVRIERVKELQRALGEKNALVEQYESQLSNKSKAITDHVMDYKSECEKLNKEIDRLLEENALLESRLGKGEYDPTKTKVLHMTMNPSTAADNNKSLENNVGDQKLIEENHRLLMQVNDSEKKLDRLKLVFKQKINEFREGVYALLGYKIDVDQQNRYKLQSMYAEKESDYLMFQYTANKGGRVGNMELLETAFTDSLDREIKAYLFTCKSIPSFLSQVTIELFSRQTFHP
ncbi:hypothetical protein CYY_006350 [Polysphondylium violaceum]|uniref:Mitotic spindle assembly checkpoint protein MAD1 n=1 Tax=Polysphondylium violaceum TaxID=133409 RepID=A0A8J4PS12_9MYCE|nr:hypothetical protein CYY_006350 [Polysphondylium violaceum]